MTATLLSILTSSVTLPALTSALVLLLGLCRKSEWYRTTRASWGRLCESAGVGLSALGKTKLRLLWDPLEQFFNDFVLFGFEQLGVGLRKDNPERLERQVERLEDVGSMTRAEALQDKLDLLRHPEPVRLRDAREAAVAYRAAQLAKAATQGRLEG